MGRTGHLHSSFAGSALVQLEQTGRRMDRQTDRLLCAELWEDLGWEARGWKCKHWLWMEQGGSRLVLGLGWSRGGEERSRQLGRASILPMPENPGVLQLYVRWCLGAGQRK